MDVRETLRPCRKSAREMMLCNTQENRGRSARDRRTVRKSNAQIFSWMWARSSSPPSSFPHRSETSSARPLAPPSPPPFDLLPPATISRFLARASSPAPPPPSPAPQPSFSRPELPPPPPVTIGTRLKLCSTVDPLLRSSFARTDRKNGFVVSYLCSPAFFPFRCAPPAPVNGRRRRACCRLSCDVKKTNRGRSAQGGRTVRKLG